MISCSWKQHARDQCWRVSVCVSSYLSGCLSVCLCVCVRVVVVNTVWSSDALRRLLCHMMFGGRQWQRGRHPVRCHGASSISQYRWTHRCVVITASPWLAITRLPPLLLLIMFQVAYHVITVIINVITLVIIAVIAAAAVTWRCPPIIIIFLITRLRCLATNINNNTPWHHF